MSTKSLVPIIERTRDTNAGVRKAAFEVLIEKISIRAMKISYRMKVLDSGLRKSFDKIIIKYVLELNYVSDGYSDFCLSFWIVFIREIFISRNH